MVHFYRISPPFPGMELKLSTGLPFFVMAVMAVSCFLAF
jgi:hypothetical protein